MWIMLIPARALSRSIVRWCWLPLPPEAYCSGGLARRAYSMNSGNVCAGTEGLTAMKNPFQTKLATGARSFWGSKGIFPYRCGLITIRLSMPRSSVCPSDGDFATSSPARLPLPPTRFSTTTGCPSASVSLGAIRRATMSGPPPGGIGTSRRMGRDGYCATASWQRPAASRATRRSRMGSLSCPSSSARPELRVSCRVQHPEHNNAPRFDQVKNCARKPGHNSAANVSMYGNKHLRKLLDAPQRGLNRREELLSEPGALLFVPVEAGAKIILEAPAKNDRQCHRALRTPDSTCSSVRTSS